jgi:AraC family transcriptional regulator
MRSWRRQPTLKGAVTLVNNESKRSQILNHHRQTFNATGGLATWQIQRVRVYVDDHLTEVIRLSALAAVAKLSVSYFAVAFRRSFGVSFTTFLALERIERAKTMLLATDKKISRIALSCGFRDPAGFSRRFRQVVGSTPRNWRRTNRAHQEEAATAAPIAGEGVCQAGAPV